MDALKGDKELEDKHEGGNKMVQKKINLTTVESEDIYMDKASERSGNHR